jgi:hypothetical protein
MTLYVDPWHWLMPDGSLPEGNLRLRRNVLKVARVIEYGALLQIREGRETLIECTKRPNRKPCTGLLRVLKSPDSSLIAFCPACQTEHMVVYNWGDTLWSEGQVTPVPVRMNGKTS